MSVRLLNTGVSALNATAAGLEVIGNNIANSLTTAFKSSDAKYSTRFYDVISSSSPSSESAAGRLPVAVGLGTKVVATVTNFKAGNVVETGKPLDLAIEGSGFFKVRDITTGSVFATRTGEFSVDNLGYLSTLDRKHVQGLSGGDFQFAVSKVGQQYVWNITQTVPVSTTPTDIKIIPGPITVADGRIDNQTGDADAQIESLAPSQLPPEIDDTGNITIRFNNGQSFLVGKILLLNVNDPSALTPDENGLYTYSPSEIANTFVEIDSTPGKNGLGKISANSLESSNVDLTEEFANLIKTQRAFQAGARMVDTASQILNTVVNLGS